MWISPSPYSHGPSASSVYHYKPINPKKKVHLHIAMTMPLYRSLQCVRAIISACALAVASGSCSDTDSCPPVYTSDVYLRFTVNSTDTSPEARASEYTDFPGSPEENRIDFSSPFTSILLFGTDDRLLLSVPGTDAYAIPDNNDNTVYSLTARISARDYDRIASSPLRIAIAAGAPSTAAVNPPAGSTLSQVLDMQTGRYPGSYGLSVIPSVTPFSGGYDAGIPMWGLRSGITLQALQGKGTEDDPKICPDAIWMLRSWSKVEIVAADGVNLTDRVLTTSNSTYRIGPLGMKQGTSDISFVDTDPGHIDSKLITVGSPTDADTDALTFTPAPGATKSYACFYVPESVATDLIDNPSIGFRLDGTAYTFPLAEYSDDGKPIEGTSHQLIRNHIYRFEISLSPYQEVNINVRIRKWLHSVHVTDL